MLRAVSGSGGSFNTLAKAPNPARALNTTHFWCVLRCEVESWDEAGAGAERLTSDAGDAVQPLRSIILLHSTR